LEKQQEAMTHKTPNSEHYYSSQPKSESKLGLIRTRLRRESFEFMTASSVFSKKRVDTGTRLLIESMILPETGKVLDVGSGYGAIGIVAARLNPSLQVVLMDVNMRAVCLARENIERNNIVNAQVRCGFLYEPVEDLTFKCVLSNPPVSAGMNTVKAIITEAPKIMEPKAILQMVVKSKIGRKTLPAIFETVFGSCRVLARKGGYRVFISEKQ
jgi:16S rRNA (guanine1207-N2)-methyltransferase